MRKEIDWQSVDWWSIGFTVIIVLGIWGVIADRKENYATSQSQVVVAEVVDKIFSGGDDARVGVGPNVGGDGGMTVVFVGGTSDKFYLVLQVNGDIFREKVSEETFFSTAIGNQVSVEQVEWFAKDGSPTKVQYDYVGEN